MDKKTISIRLTEEEYNRLMLEVKASKQSGRKTSAAKYIKRTLISHWDTIDLFLSKALEA